MKAVLSTVWACGSCRAPYLHKGSAEECCRCRSCGEQGVMMGLSRDNHCRRCLKKRELQDIEDNVAKHVESLRELKARRVELAEQLKGA